MEATETIDNSAENLRRRQTRDYSSSLDQKGITTYGIVCLVVIVCAFFFIIFYCCYRERNKRALSNHNLHSGDTPQLQPPSTIPASEVLSGQVFSDNFYSPQERARLDEINSAINSAMIGLRISGEGTNSQIRDNSNCRTTQSRRCNYPGSHTFRPCAPTTNPQGSKIENDFEDPPPPYPGI